MVRSVATLPCNEVACARHRVCWFSECMHHHVTAGLCMRLARKAAVKRE